MNRTQALEYARQQMLIDIADHERNYEPNVSREFARDWAVVIIALRLLERPFLVEVAK